MPRGIKQKTGLDTDFSITDAVKRAKTRRSQLEAAGNVTSNPVDDLNSELERMDEPENVRKIFED